MKDLALIVKRLEIVTERLEAVGDNVGAGQNGVSQAEKLNVSVTAFDDICNGVFKAFLGKQGRKFRTINSIATERTGLGWARIC